jgi:5-methylthioadenosine/S-adenosylhomocysteine deaminase
MSATLIKNLDYIVTVDDNASVVRNASVLIVDGVIAAIGDVASHPQASTATVVDGSGKLLMPGLVNLHTHTPMTLLRGLSEDVDLQGFLNKVWAAEGAAMDPDTTFLGAQLGALESLQAGSTTQLDMYFHHVETHAGALTLGTRHIAGPTFFDFPGPDKKSWEQRMDFLAAWPAQHKEMGGAQTPGSMCPHGTYTISPEHLRDLTDVVKSWDNGLMTIHMSENLAENADVVHRYGMSPTRVLHGAGALDGDLRVVFGHGVHLNEEDRKIVVKANASVAHCPGSNMKLASGALHWRQFHDDGVRVGIGTDGCSSSNDLDMFQAMRQAALLARLTVGRADVTPAIEFVRGATIEGAKAVGLDHLIGSVEVGKRADLVLLDLEAPHLVPVNDVHALIVFAAGRSDVSDVFVDGKHVLKNRHSTLIDEKELLHNARIRGAVAAKAAAEA